MEAFSARCETHRKKKKTEGSKTSGRRTECVENDGCELNQWGGISNDDENNEASRKLGGGLRERPNDLTISKKVSSNNAYLATQAFSPRIPVTDFTHPQTGPHAHERLAREFWRVTSHKGTRVRPAAILSNSKSRADSLRL